MKFLNQMSSSRPIIILAEGKDNFFVSCCLLVFIIFILLATNYHLNWFFVSFSEHRFN